MNNREEVLTEKALQVLITRTILTDTVTHAALPVT